MSDVLETTDEVVEQITVPEISIHYSRLVLPAIISTWVLCLLIGPIAVIRAWNPAINWAPLMVMLTAAALQGVFGTRWLLAPGQRLLNKGPFRIAEFVLIVVVVRLMVWATVAPPTPGQLRELLLDPLAILDGGYMLFLFFALASWSTAGSISRIFYGMAVLPEEEEYFTARRTQTDGRLPDAFGIIHLRSSQLSSFLSYWLNGALLLALCTAAASIDLQELGDGTLRNVTRLGLPSELLVALILFFVLGLWLLSWGRLQVMQLRWLTERRVVHRPVPGQWQRSSLLLIAGVALLAGFLPIGSTFALARLVEAIFNVAFQIVGFLMSLLFLLIAFLFSLFGSSPPESLQQPEPPPLEPPPLVPAESFQELSETALMVRGGIFWLVAIVAVLVLLVFFLRERGYQLDSRILRALWRDLRLGLRRLWGYLFGRVELASRAIRQRLALGQASDDTNQPPWRFVNLRNLPPREQVRYFYLSIVRRAEAQGVERRAAETPLEFVNDLRQEWPEAEDEIKALTDAFLEARYSADDISAGEAGLIKRTWQQVRSGIRKRRHGPD
ncbi:MAG: DUF4129 domain-containing protein [Anaerolineales bacterium]|nr:DUF4129 domain-containing protein [Anaerolineales bacterium]MCB0016998.1 DUF4129 domain-containing protein [Anaerolineales bacterium]